MIQWSCELSQCLANSCPVNRTWCIILSFKIIIHIYSCMSCFMTFFSYVYDLVNAWSTNGAKSQHCSYEEIHFIFLSLFYSQVSKNALW